jgi:hypothetical protein
LAATHYKLNDAVLNIGGSEFQAQVTQMTVNNNTGDPERFYTYGGTTSSFVEAADPEFTLDLSGFADWTLGGFSDYLWAHDGETVSFQLDWHPTVVGSHVRWSGSVQVKAPNSGGEIRSTETTETSLAIVDAPTYSRIG